LNQLVNEKQKEEALKKNSRDKKWLW